MPAHRRPLLPERVRAPGDPAQRAPRPGLRRARLAPPHQPGRHRHRAGVPALPLQRASLQLCAPRLQRRHAADADGGQRGARIRRDLPDVEDRRLARSRGAVPAMTSAAAIAGRARTTPAARTPAAEAIAPSTRLARGRTPRNAIPQSATIRPRWDSVDLELEPARRGRVRGAGSRSRRRTARRWPRAATASARRAPCRSRGGPSVSAIRLREPAVRPATTNAAVTAPAPNAPRR